MSRIRTNLITNRMANGAPTVSNGLVISGVTTSTTFSGSGASLTNLPSAQLTGALPALDGSNLTGITQTTINNNANNRIITGSGTANTLEGESNLTYDGTNLQLQTDANNEGIKINSTLSGGSSYPVFEMEANRGVGNTLGKLVQKWNGTQVASIQFSSGTDGTNKDDAHIHFNTASAGTVIERMKITSTGAVGINTTSPG